MLVICGGNMRYPRAHWLFVAIEYVIIWMTRRLANILAQGKTSAESSEIHHLGLLHTPWISNVFQSVFFFFCFDTFFNMHFFRVFRFPEQAGSLKKMQLTQNTQKATITPQRKPHSL